MAKRTTFTPVPLFDLDTYCIEYPPSVSRVRSMQEAAEGEAMDIRIPVDARRHNLTRMKGWIDALLDRIAAEGDDHDHQPRPWATG